MPHPAVLRVPWWAVEGFSADGSEHAPDGRRLQVVELVTSAGTLGLLCPASEVGSIVAELSRWARRWRVARSPLVRSAARVAAMGSAAAAPVATAVGAHAARAARPAVRALAPVAGPAGRALDAVGAPLAPVGRLVARRPISILSIAAAFAVWLAVMVGGAGGVPTFGSPRTAASVSAGFDSSGMAAIMTAAEFQAGAGSHLVPATAPPPPAPPSVAAEPPLTSHEVFGFAPYWTLPQSGSFDVSGFTTIAYFAVPVNGNGTLQESGTGWDGYQSQDFADLVARAHAAGDRVVLTVNCFSQAALDQVTSSGPAQQTLAAEVVSAIAAKNLDGVNIDFEGQGSGDQAGLTSLVGTVSSAVHAANPHYQVTMDTYASSAGDPNGFYDIPALAPEVDGFFVMAYNLNLGADASPASPITSPELSDTAAAAEYAAAVPPSKVIFGTSYFGYTWPTTNGTMAASGMGTPVPVSYSQAVSSGEPIYWDPVTDSAWTSYEIGTQWYETYFLDPASIYMVAQLAQREGFAGVGAWALGMDGSDPQMTSALDGHATPVRAGPAGPASTSQSAPLLTALPAPVSVAPGLPLIGLPTTTTGPAAGPGTTTTTTTAPSYSYRGVFEGGSVTLTPSTPTPHFTGLRTLVGTLTGFSTADPTFACLVSPSQSLQVWLDRGSSVYDVVAAQPTNCMTADFSFPVPASAGTGATSTTAAGTGNSARATGSGSGTAGSASSGSGGAGGAGGAGG